MDVQEGRLNQSRKVGIMHFPHACPAVQNLATLQQQRPKYGTLQCVRWSPMDYTMLHRAAAIIT